VIWLCIFNYDARTEKDLRAKKSRGHSGILVASNELPMTEIKNALLRISLGVFLALLAPGLVALAETATPEALSKIEATHFAQQFFDSEIAFEGALGDAFIKGDYWAFPVKFGYAGMVQPDPLLVHRQSRKVSWAGLAAHNAALGRRPNEVSR
jgi:hypothetical protein